nr:hypothetical protein [Tanacetum cinerariifolium]
MFRINPFKTSREEKHVPNKVNASVRTNPISVSEPPVITKKVVNSDSNGLFSTGVDNTKTRRPQPRRNKKNDRVAYVSESSQSKNKEVKVEKHHRNLMLSRNKKHMSSECNNVVLANQNVKVVCAMRKQFLNSVNHDVCLLNYVNGMNSRGKKQKENVSINEKRKRQQPKLLINFVWKFLGTVRFGNDHVAAMLGFDDLQWGNILITRAKVTPSSYGSVCGPMRTASINGKRYVLVNVDDYSRYTWVQFLRSKDEAPEVIKPFLKRITILLQSLIIIIRIDNDTEFKNQVLKEYFYSVGISHQVSSIHTPQQNRVVERRHPTSKDEVPEVIKTFLKRITVLLQSFIIIIRIDNDTEFKNQVLKEYFDKATRTMLIFSCASLFLWAEAIATECFTQNRSIIHCCFNKTPYQLINGRKPDISFLHVFGALCYPKNDREDIGKLGAKGDIGFFIGYSADSCAYKVYKRRTKKIMETMNVSFDELSAMAFEQRSSKHGLQSMTFGQISSRLDLTYAPSTRTTQQPTEGELDLLFEAMYDDYIGDQPSAALRTVLAA